MESNTTEAERFVEYGGERYRIFETDGQTYVVIDPEGNMPNLGWIFENNYVPVMEIKDPQGPPPFTESDVLMPSFYVGDSERIQIARLWWMGPPGNRDLGLSVSESRRIRRLILENVVETINGDEVVLSCTKDVFKKDDGSELKFGAHFVRNSGGDFGIFVEIV